MLLTHLSTTTTFYYNVLLPSLIIIILQYLRNVATLILIPQLTTPAQAGGRVSQHTQSTGRYNKRGADRDHSERQQSPFEPNASPRRGRRTGWLFRWGNTEVSACESAEELTGLLILALAGVSRTIRLECRSPGSQATPCRLG